MNLASQNLVVTSLNVWLLNIPPMVDAQAAGVGFTCDPQTGRRDILVINTNFGLGESVVAGTVEPDTYYLEASPWCAVPQLIERKTGRKVGNK